MKYNIEPGIYLLKKQDKTYYWVYSNKGFLIKLESFAHTKHFTEIKTSVLVIDHNPDNLETRLIVDKYPAKLARFFINEFLDEWTLYKE